MNSVSFVQIIVAVLLIFSLKAISPNAYPSDLVNKKLKVG